MSEQELSVIVKTLLLDMNDSELETVSRNLYRKANHLFEKVNRLENDAETIKKFIQLRKEYNYEMPIEKC